MFRETILRDTRAVEGMPVRLVVAITVGAAAFGLLVPMLDSVERTAESEIRAVPDSAVVVLDSPDAYEELTIAVRTADGNPVRDASIILSGRSLDLPAGPLVFETGQDDNEIQLTVGMGPGNDVRPVFRPHQSRGTLSLAVKPPAGESTVAGSSPDVTVRITEIDP